MSPLTVQGTVSLSSEERSWLEVWRKSEACATFEQEKKQLPLEGPDETKEEGFATSSDEDGIGETPITPIPNPNHSSESDSRFTTQRKETLQKESQEAAESQIQEKESQGEERERRTNT